jgi:hypothetical protein
MILHRVDRRTHVLTEMMDLAIAGFESDAPSQTLLPQSWRKLSYFDHLTLSTKQILYINV